MNMASLKVPATCQECGKADLQWFTTSVNNSDVPEGRLRSHEVGCLFVLGCQYCDATVATRNADAVADAMNMATVVTA